MKLISFKAKLLLTSSLMIVGALVVSNAVSYLDTMQFHSDNAVKQMALVVGAERTALQDYMNDKINSVESVADLYKSDDDSAPVNHIDRVKIASQILGTEAFIVGLETEMAYGSTWPGFVKPKNFNPKERSWYIDARNNPGNVIVTDIYQDFLSKKNLIGIAASFDDGVVLADISLDEFKRAIGTLTQIAQFGILFDESGFVISSTSTILKANDNLQDNPDTTVVYNSVQSMGKSSGTIEYKVDNKSKIGFVEQIKVGNKTWYLMAGMWKADLFQSAEDSGQKSLIAAFIFMLVSLIMINVIIHFAYKPIKVLRKTVADLASGDADLTRRLEVDGNDDLDMIASDINTFVGNLQTIMRDVDGVAKLMDTNVSVLLQTSDKNSEILRTHVTETEQVVTAIEEMNATSESVAKSAATAAEYASLANTNGETSQKAAGQAGTVVSALAQNVDNNSERVKQMTDSTTEIKVVLEVIAGIADQTNLLALNAAIEAARAGEQGRGFAVVADEVRQLASRTQASTGEIEDVVKKLTESSSHVLEGMTHTRQVCVETVESAGVVTSHLDELKGNIILINDANAEIATAAEQQSSVSKELNRNVSSISEIVKELEKADGEMLEKVHSINDAKQKLTEIVGRFKI